METRKIYMNDGRQAEERSYIDEDGRKVTEIWTEEPKNPVPLRLAERVTEKKTEVITERIIDKVDLATGDIIERKVESIEPTVKLELREHIGLAAANQFITKGEAEAIAAQAMKTVKAQNAPKFSARNFVEARVKAQRVSSNMIDLILMGVIVIGAGVAVYKLFF